MDGESEKHEWEATFLFKGWDLRRKLGSDLWEQQGQGGGGRGTLWLTRCIANQHPTDLFPQPPASPRVLTGLVHPTDFNTCFMTGESLQDKDREALLCFRSAQCLSTPPTPQLGESLSAVHGSAFSGHKLEVTVHTTLGLFRKCFFRKNVGWGFLDLAASSLLACLSLLEFIYSLLKDILVTRELWQAVNKAARDACRFPCNLHQHRRVWDLRAKVTGRAGVGEAAFQSGRAFCAHPHWTAPLVPWTPACTAAPVLWTESP